jgi:hypothetical protein
MSFDACGSAVVMWRPANNDELPLPQKQWIQVTGVGKAQNAMRPILKFKIVDPRRGRSLIAQWRQIL